MEDSEDYEEEDSEDAYQPSRRRYNEDASSVEMRPFNRPAPRRRGKSESGRAVTHGEMQRYFDAVELASTMRRKSADCTPLLIFYRVVVILLLIVRTRFQ